MQSIIELCPHECADDLISVTVRQPEEQHRAVLGGCVLELYNKSMRARFIARFASVNDILDLGYKIIAEARKLQPVSQDALSADKEFAHPFAINDAVDHDQAAAPDPFPLTPLEKTLAHDLGEPVG